MRSIRVIALSALASLAAVSAAHADVQVMLAGGRVSIVAKDATVEEILSEWARVGQAEIVNLDAVPRARVTIELRDVTEDYALGVLLRGAGGYVARRRPASASDLSLFDRLLIMRQSAVKAAPAPPATAQTPARPDEVEAVEEPPVAATPSDDPATGQAAEQTPAREGRSRRTPASVLADGTPVFSRVGAGDAAAAAEAAAVDQPAASSPAAPQAAPAQRATQALGRNEPPPRAMPSGLAAARRVDAPPRDQSTVKAPPAADTSSMDQVAPGPEAVTDMPTPDPALQEAYKQRQATEVLDPRNFKMPPPPPAPKRGPGLE